MPVKIPGGDFEGRLKQTHSPGSLLPVPTERERENLGTRLRLKLSLFTGAQRDSVVVESS